MATRVLFKSLTFTTNQTLFSGISTTTTIITPSSIPRFRPLIAAAAASLCHAATNIRSFYTYQNRLKVEYVDQNLNPPPQKKDVFPDYENGCDYEHWLVIVEKPQGQPTRDEIIDSYINILAQVVGSYDAARMKIYSVSTRFYYAFGALISPNEVLDIRAVRGVVKVMHDSYLDKKNKDYGGEPFIDGKAVPYDPKYHAAWIGNRSKVHDNVINEKLIPPPQKKKYVFPDYENGCDYEHWLVIVEKPQGQPTRDEIIDSYINILAQVVGSYDAARMKIYSVSTRFYYAFGALISPNEVLDIRAVRGVVKVMHDSYLDKKNKDYGGEPFIDGKAVPYDPKYHAAWIGNENKNSNN